MIGWKCIFSGLLHNTRPAKGIDLKLANTNSKFGIDLVSEKCIYHINVKNVLHFILVFLILEFDIQKFFLDNITHTVDN